MVSYRSVDDREVFSRKIPSHLIGPWTPLLGFRIPVQSTTTGLRRGSQPWTPLLGSIIITGVQPGKILRWTAFVGSGRGPLAYMTEAAGAMRKMMIDCPIPLTERN
jgi:hypothetical protein